ncbi:hypothetical protein [Bradyrhizobium sp. AUGA SZCCT0182]|uniref:hypothetical protein n=1 Tax=Bradyrhizobium sp. AUGA SZCCT0182 TaxID=2807667 RepID=UPI001BA68F09|nr:hypothetical protein [Bradyrhizobium sp. AUGA SZCCT0182]MBR1237444.1 hypothetical protein [Bradyrhizobium sp. AUGA SZCCT0182]
MVLPRALLGSLPQDMSVQFGLCGAFCMGLCSLLAHDYNAQKARPDDVSGSRS